MLPPSDILKTQTTNDNDLPNYTTSMPEDISWFSCLVS